MTQTALIFVGFLSFGIHSVNGCLPTSTASSSGGEIPITTTDILTLATTVSTTAMTTTTRAPCEQKENLALFYQQDDVTLSSGTAEPVSSCLDCDGGQAQYFESTSGDDPRFGSQDIGTMTTSTCENYCICDWNDECFRPAPSTSVRFYPYCSDGTCGTYVSIRSGSLQSTTTTTVYTADAQKISSNPTKVGYKPFTDPSYFSAKSIGCTNCLPTSCSG